MNNIDYLNIPTYDQCMDLVLYSEEENSFIFTDEVLDGIEITSFNYNIAQYSDFTRYGARNMRGITFRKDTKEMIALPFHKFFNFNENPYTEENNIKDKRIKRVTEKFDGSLIYFFILNNKLHCKTKKNSFSDQANMAMTIVNNNPELKDEILEIIKNNYTPLFEFISYLNQIVILYQSHELIYLGSRNMKNGKYDFDYKIKNCKNVTRHNIKSIDEAIHSIKTDSDNREGVVVLFEDYDMAKFKTEEYMKLHNIRDHIFNAKTLAELILNEKIDDIKSHFHNSKEIIDHIENMEKKVWKSYFNILNDSNEYYENNKNLNRKEFALKGMKELDKFKFAVAMDMYSGKFNESQLKEKFIQRKLWEEERMLC